MTELAQYLAACRALARPRGWPRWPAVVAALVAVSFAVAPVRAASPSQGETAPGRQIQARAKAKAKANANANAKTNAESQVWVRDAAGTRVVSLDAPQGHGSRAVPPRALPTAAYNTNSRISTAGIAVGPEAEAARAAAKRRGGAILSSAKGGPQATVAAGTATTQPIRAADGQAVRRSGKAVGLAKGESQQGALHACKAARDNANLEHCRYGASRKKTGPCSCSRAADGNWTCTTRYEETCRSPARPTPSSVHTGTVWSTSVVSEGRACDSSQLNAHLTSCARVNILDRQVGQCVCEPESDGVRFSCLSDYVLWCQRADDPSPVEAWNPSPWLRQDKVTPDDMLTGVPAPDPFQVMR